VKHNRIYLIPVALLALTAIPAAAEDTNIIMPMDGRTPTQSYQGLGTINSVNVKAGKVNLSHGPIPSLGWKAMTMNYEVQDKDLLANLKKGQKVAFTLVEARKGQYVISDITVVK
jgi:Cu(I)/Ag(I) efflux system periplasmic protein CusF